MQYIRSIFGMSESDAILSVRNLNTQEVAQWPQVFKLKHLTESSNKGRNLRRIVAYNYSIIHI